MSICNMYLHLEKKQLEQNRLNWISKRRISIYVNLVMTDKQKYFGEVYIRGSRKILRYLVRPSREDVNYHEQNIDMEQKI